MKSATVWIVSIYCLSSVAFAGPITSERKSQFEKAMSAIMASATPQVTVDVRERLIKDYVNGKPNKGQAVLVVEGRYFRSENHEDVAATGDRTLEACQLRYAKPCALLAVNDEIAAEGELVPKDMPRLRYTGKFDLSQLPIIRLAARNRTDVQGYGAAEEPKAIAIHPWGRLFISSGNTSVGEAQTVALTKCNADTSRNSRDGPCFVYAVNNDVILPERRTVAK